MRWCSFLPICFSAARPKGSDFGVEDEDYMGSGLGSYAVGFKVR